MQVNSSGGQISQHLQDQQTERKNISKEQEQTAKQQLQEQQKAQEAAKITGIGQSLNITV